MNIKNIPREKLYTAIRVFSLGALVFASMLAVDYYFVTNTFCAEGAACSKVAQSDFGQKYGIFLPTLGLLAYSFFFLTSFFFAKTKLKVFGKSLSTFWVPIALICCAVGAMGFILIQTLQIHAFCYMCMGIDTCAILAVIPAVLLLMKGSENQDAAPTKLHPALWIALYFAAACTPIALGTRSSMDNDNQPTAQANDQIDDQLPMKSLPNYGKVPDYIKSFYIDGKINIVEISSFDCPHCKKLHPKLSALLAEYGDAINFRRLTIPLTAQLEACVAYYCAEKQKKEIEFADCLFEKPSKEPGQLLEYARKCSINEDSFKSCVTDPASTSAITDMIDNIKKSGFKGAPTIWIDDEQIIGFNESKGIRPYREAIEKNPLSDKYDHAHSIDTVDDSSNIRAKYAFLTTMTGLILGLFSLIAGIALTITSKKENSITNSDVA